MRTLRRRETGSDNKVVLELQPIPDFLLCSTTLCGSMFPSTTLPAVRAAR